MARVQLLISDEELARIRHQARKEGLTLSAWLRTAAKEQLTQKQRVEPFLDRAELNSFFQECDSREGPLNEPEWDEHLAVIRTSRKTGEAAT